MSVTEINRVLQAEERLAEKLVQYAGKWVAVKDHEVICAESTLRAVLERINPKEVDRIFEVSEDTGSLCLL